MSSISLQEHLKVDDEEGEDEDAHFTKGRTKAQIA